VTFRTRTFLGVFLTSALALGVSTLLVERSLRRSTTDDIAAGLLSQARLAASLVTHETMATDPDAEADTMGARLGARVTLIDAAGH
jgi:hypothetical protein